MNKILLGEMTREDAKERFAVCDLAILPVGSFEQHGPHLPLSTDAFDAIYIAEKSVEKVSDPKPVVCPPINYGVSGYHMDFPGTITFLKSISTSYPLVCMSNTNPIHWPFIRDQLGIGEYFIHTCISYETGYLKPDPEAFENLIQKLACAPNRIAFFDDNEINTRGARASGISAWTVQGVKALNLTLADLNIFT